MLRDEADRIVGAARGTVLAFPVPEPLRDIEKAWIHTCQRAGVRGEWISEPGSLEDRVLAGLRRCDLTSAHMGVLRMHGDRGRRPDRNCAIAQKLWFEAINALDVATDLTGAAVQ